MNLFDALEALQDEKKVKVALDGHSTILHMEYISNDDIEIRDEDDNRIYYLPSNAYYEVVKESILTKGERKYLENVLMPYFCQNIEYVKKECGRIVVVFEEQEEGQFNLVLPLHTNLMEDYTFQGIKEGVHYGIIKDLGLFLGGNERIFPYDGK